jgi:hypothetical protein
VINEHNELENLARQWKISLSERKSQVSLKIVAVSEHEDPEITCATHTVIVDDADRKRLVLADISPEMFQGLRACRAIDIDPLQRGKIVAHDYEASRLTDMLKDWDSFPAPLSPEKAILKSYKSLQIIDLDQDADIERTGVSFIVLFKDTEQNRTMIATLSIQFHEPLERFCRSLDVESLQYGELVAHDYDACDLVQAIKKRCRADLKAPLESESN